MNRKVETEGIYHMFILNVLDVHYVGSHWMWRWWKGKKDIRQSTNQEAVGNAQHYASNTMLHWQ